ncbi:MAG: PilZ domain-containing protein [Acidobacteria bacterium]|nr:PilZ domain-containing protein [Acidobacteriota bacterium]MDA1234321.1 PilZ domain-containing protein [Acidobacteriota bacterium]
MSNTETPAKAAQMAPAIAVSVNKRSHPRTSTRAVVLIYWLDENRLPCESTAVIKDVSAGGFGIRTDRGFPQGKSITVRTPERSLECVVRHVTEQPHSFMVGLQIRSSSDGSGQEQSLEGLSSALAAASGS